MAIHQVLHNGGVTVVGGGEQRTQEGACRVTPVARWQPEGAMGPISRRRMPCWKDGDAQIRTNSSHRGSTLASARRPHPIPDCLCEGERRGGQRICHKAITPLPSVLRSTIFWHLSNLPPGKPGNQRMLYNLSVVCYVRGGIMRSGPIKNMRNICGHFSVAENVEFSSRNFSRNLLGELKWRKRKKAET